jgi:hypothetical protein
MTASSPVAYMKVPRPTREEYDDDLSDFEDAQSISGTNIDPTKLTMLLRIKFGAGAYDIHVSTPKDCERPAT